MADDSIIIQRVLNGETQEFNFIVEKHISDIHRLIFSYVKDKFVTDDIVQETFIKAFKSLKNFKGKSSFKTYLYRIAINESKTYFNKNKKQFDIEFNEKIQTAGSYKLNPDEILESKILAEVFDKAIKCMSPKLREIIILKDRENMSYEMIAKILKIPLGTVESRLFLARKKLKEVFLSLYKKGNIN